MRLIGSLLLFSATLLADPSLLPLQNGNTWTYQERGRQASFTVRVGTPAVIGGNVYYRLIGYVTEPLWVRWGNFDTLYYRDEEKEQDFPLTVFQRNTGGRFQAPFRICDSLGRAEDGGRHDGPIGPMTATMRIRYVNVDCADVGVVDEQYASNIGMIERTEQSFGGPRLFDLVSARIGASTIQTGPGTNLGVTLRKPENGAGLLAILELKVNGPDPVKLHYLSSQEFDAVIRDDNGTAVWQWSEGKTFLPRIMDELTFGRSWTIDVPLTDRSGAALPEGKYSLEAWIASGVDRTQFAGTAPLRIPEKE